jgi:hypothetical protein
MRKWCSLGRIRTRLARLVSVVLVCLGVASGGCHAWAENSGQELLQERSSFSNWSFEIGAAPITANVIEEILLGQYERARGAAGGMLYHLNVSYRIREFEWKIGERVFHPELEAPFTLVIADENRRSPFLVHNAGVRLRWTDFPWNRYIYTTAATGVGMTYSERIFTIERERHPGRYRSHVKFYWPLQVTLAHPHHRQHQLMVFIHHHSGGRIFDRGGVNALGVGYRHVFK